MSGSAKRRVVLGSLLGVAAGAGGYGFSRAWKDNTAEGSRLRRPTDALHLQVIAHPDDDLYFFNPDLTQAIQSGCKIVTVCLTGGETDGKNYAPDDPRLAAEPVNYEKYVAARNSGLRAAYADQALGKPDSTWRRELMLTPTGSFVEVNTLEAAPRIKLLFLNLWQEGSRSPSGKAARLRTLWTMETGQQPAMVPLGSPMPHAFPYDREGLIKTLVSIFETYQPSLVRTMDPDPDHQVHDVRNPRGSDFGDFSDHEDHTACGLFTWAALQEWWSRGGGARAVVESYRGYYNQRWPANLSKPAADDKARYLATYGWGDARTCPDPSGCGDRKVGAAKSLLGIGQSTTYRHGTGTNWLKSGHDGRLVAFAVQGGGAVVKTEDLRGRGWTDVQRIDGSNLLPYLVPVLKADGRWELFGVRMVLHADGAMQSRDLVMMTQQGEGFGGWTSLGNPGQLPGRDPVERRCVGLPVVVENSVGRLAIFVRNFGYGMSLRQQVADDEWGPWVDLPGAGIQDGIAAALTPSGRFEVFGSTKTGVMRWYQDEPGSLFRYEELRIPAPASPPTTLQLADGRLVLLVRRANTAEVVGYVQAQPDGPWIPEPRDLAARGGHGPIAGVVGPNGRISIAYRDDKGFVSVSTHPSWEGREDGRADGDMLFAHSASIAVDKQNRLVLAAQGTDGLLRISQPDLR